ncbi:MAG: hypothetical protein KDA84_14790, partial [Planctomycetaceae bacterium]|nr:hypothetical protein [Planctomycetaceae bacterium]
DLPISPSPRIAELGCWASWWEPQVRAQTKSMGRFPKKRKECGEFPQELGLTDFGTFGESPRPSLNRPSSGDTFQISPLSVLQAVP